MKIELEIIWELGRMEPSCIAIEFWVSAGDSVSGGYAQLGNKANCMYVLAKLSDFRNLMVFIEFISWVLSFYLLLWRTYERAILLQGSWTVLEGPIWWSSEWGIFEDRGEHCMKRSRMTSTAYVQLSKWELFRTGLFSATTWRCEDYMWCLFFIKKFNTVCFASGIHWIYYGGPGRL